MESPEDLPTKTHAAVMTLAGSLQEVVARQSRYERGLNLNSFVAYVLFTALLGGGFALLYRSRSGALVAERDAAVERLATLEKETAEAREALAARKAADGQAMAFWKLLQEGKRAEAIAAHPQVAAASLTPVEAAVFEERVSRARVELIDENQSQGIEAFRQGQYKRAIGPLERALTYEKEGTPRAAELRYYLGVALFKQGEHAKAATQLEKAAAGGADRTVGADARFFLGSALEALSQPEKARAEYERFAGSRPGHLLAPAALRRARNLALTRER